LRKKAMLSRRRILSCVAASAAIVLISNPAVAKAKVSGGPGTSRETAFIIKADNMDAGVPVEYAILAKRFPKWERTAQSLREVGGKRYDVHRISYKGETKEVWFDITSFYGKY
jgi:hypothetical protein